MVCLTSFNLILRIYFATLVMFYVVNFSQFWCKVAYFFPILARGLFPKLLEKALLVRLGISQTYLRGAQGLSAWLEIWGVPGPSLTRGTVLWPWARHFNLYLVVVQPRKHTNTSEKNCWLGRKESTQTNKPTYLTSDGPEEDGGLCTTSCLSGMRNPAILNKSRIMWPLMLISNWELECRLKDKKTMKINVWWLVPGFILIHWKL